MVEPAASVPSAVALGRTGPGPAVSADCVHSSRSPACQSPTFAPVAGRPVSVLEPNVVERNRRPSRRSPRGTQGWPRLVARMRPSQQSQKMPGETSEARRGARCGRRILSYWIMSWERLLLGPGRDRPFCRRLDARTARRGVVAPDWKCPSVASGDWSLRVTTPVVAPFFAKEASSSLS